jgi:hypothetical protein
LLHGTSTATVTTARNLPSNVATRLKLGMLARRIGVGSSFVSPFQMDLVSEKGARIEEAFDDLRRIGGQQTRKVFQEQFSSWSAWAQSELRKVRVFSSAGFRYSRTAWTNSDRANYRSWSALETGAALL